MNENPIDSDELSFVRWLQETQRLRATIELGIGDDMAIVKPTSDTLLVSSDMLLDGVHFDTETQPLPLIGRKAIACSLSDCAAMAVLPVSVTVSLALPTHWSLEQAQQLYEGMYNLADEYELAIAGGDTTRWSHPLAIDVAILARPFEGIIPVRRSGARVGDTLYVTGPLGGSRLDHHLTFTPRVAKARAIARSLRGGLHAMMDISDGLSLDLWRMCEASQVGATLDAGRLDKVISENARHASTSDGRSALEHALSDGEDFELLVATDVSEESVDPQLSLMPVGTVTEHGLLIHHADGHSEPLAARGYVH